MSCHFIQICDGRKMMIPVTDYSQYIRVRDSEHNKRADKRNLAQFNYSCLPNADGSLKGSKRLSRSVGMDIDLDINSESYAEDMEKIKERVLEKKEELGLLMFEKSFNKGYHIVFRRREELTQEENLAWASMLLETEYDRGAKDITRVFFTPPADRIIFIDKTALFDNEESAAENVSEREDYQSAVKAEQPSAEQKAEESVNEEEATQATLYAFDKCAELAGLDADNLDVQGVRHTNLMAILSEGLPKLVTKQQLYASLKCKMPSYYGDEECRKLVEYFYEKYSADKGYMTKKLREVNAEAQRLNKELTDDDVINELTKEYDPPKSPEKLPRLLELLVKNYDDRYRDMLLLSALPVLSAHASHFRSVYLSGKMIGPQQYVAVIGTSGSGKGNCTHLYQEMVLHTLQENDRKEWEKVKENAELRDKKANAKERPEKYHPKLRLFETTSKSSILELQTNIGKNGMLLGQFSEVDGLSASSRAAYSDISVLLRKGWDGDMHRQFYMSDATCNTFTQMSISLLMAGTPKAMLVRMFSESNTEGGLMQRCIPVLVPKGKRTFRPPLMANLDEELRNERDSLLMKLYEKDLACGEDTKLLQLSKTRREIGSFFDSLQKRYDEGMLTEAEADLSHRCGEFIMRAAIPLVALYGKETPEIMSFIRWVGEIAHYNMCHIFGKRVQDSLTESENLMNTTKADARKTVLPVLESMPKVFTSKQFSEERIKRGQSGEVRQLLSYYCKNGLIKRISQGIYQK